MSTLKKSDISFVGNIPQNYDEGLGPVIFEPYAKDLAKKASALRPAKTLELGAGTGIATKCLYDALHQYGELDATDLNADMLRIAQAKFPQSPTGLSFEVVDAMQIPKEGASYDLAVMQFGVMFMPDKVGHFEEVRRVLKPNGTYIFNVWDSWSAVLWPRVTHEAVAELIDGEPPTFYKLPFHYHNPDEIRRDLSAAGFEEIQISQHKHAGEITSMENFARGAVRGNPLLIELKEAGFDLDSVEVEAAVKSALEAEFGKSPTTIPLSAFVVSARKPVRRRGILHKIFGR